MSYFKTWPEKIESESFDCNSLSDSEWKNRQLFLVTGYHPDMDKEVAQPKNTNLFKDEEVECPF